MQAREMISSHPEVRGRTNDALIRAIEEMLNCGQVCTSCADACLAEERVAQLRQCIRLNLDCADLCVTTAQLRRFGIGPGLLGRDPDADKVEAFTLAGKQRRPSRPRGAPACRRGARPARGAPASGIRAKKSSRPSGRQHYRREASGEGEARIAAGR